MDTKQTKIIEYKIAEHVGCHKSTLCNWKKNNPNRYETLELGYICVKLGITKEALLKNQSKRAYRTSKVANCLQKMINAK